MSDTTTIAPKEPQKTKKSPALRIGVAAVLLSAIIGGAYVALEAKVLPGQVADEEAVASLPADRSFPHISPIVSDEALNRTIAAQAGDEEIGAVEPVRNHDDADLSKAQKEMVEAE